MADDSIGLASDAGIVNASSKEKIVTSICGVNEDEVTIISLNTEPTFIAI